MQGRVVAPGEGPMLQIMLGGVSANEPQLGAIAPCGMASRPPTVCGWKDAGR